MGSLVHCILSLDSHRTCAASMTVPPGKAGVNLSIGTCWYIHDGTQHKKPGFFSTAVENKARFMGRDMFCRFYVAAQWWIHTPHWFWLQWIDSFDREGFVGMTLAANVEPKPTAAFALSLLAGIFTLVGAFIASTITSLLVPGFPSDLLLIWGSIAGILVLVGSWLLYNNAAQRKLGSTLVLVFSILSMNFIGLILGLIGGFLGFTYKSTTTTTSSSSRGYTPP